MNVLWLEWTVIYDECEFPMNDVSSDLFIDDVLREDAKAVVVLLPSGRADVGDGAAHVGGERATERVDRLALLVQGHLGEHEHVPAVGSETERQRIL